MRLLYSFSTCLRQTFDLTWSGGGQERQDPNYTVPDLVDGGLVFVHGSLEPSMGCMPAALLQMVCDNNRHVGCLVLRASVFVSSSFMDDCDRDLPWMVFDDLRMGGGDRKACHFSLCLPSPIFPTPHRAAFLPSLCYLYQHTFSSIVIPSDNTCLQFPTFIAHPHKGWLPFPTPCYPTLPHQSLPTGSLPPPCRPSPITCNAICLAFVRAPFGRRSGICLHNFHL